MPDVITDTTKKHPLFDCIEVIDHGIIRSLEDFVKLNIVDWNRYKAHWDTPAHAMEVVASHFVNRMSYKIVELNLFAYPERDDFPGWKHAGNHEEIGRLYWNHFHYEFDGILHFHDRPDFSGVIRHKGAICEEVRFLGDIGQVSPITIIDSMRRSIYGNTLWISVLSCDRQVILEPPLPVVGELRSKLEKIDSLVKPLSLFNHIHVMDNFVFLKWNGQNLFVGELPIVSQMPLQEFGVRIYHLTGVKDILSKVGQASRHKEKTNQSSTQLTMF